MGYENFNQSTDPIEKDKAPGLAEGPLVHSAGTLLDSLEGGSAKLALNALMESGVNYDTLRAGLEKIPDAGRDTIGRFSDWVDGTKVKGLAERGLGERLDERLADLVALGIDLDAVRAQFDERGLQGPARERILKSAIEKSKAKGFGSESLIREAFDMNDEQLSQIASNEVPPESRLAA